MSRPDTVYESTMTERELERIGSNSRISGFGKKILEMIKEPSFNALVNPGERTPEKIAECTSTVLTQDVWGGD